MIRDVVICQSFSPIDAWQEAVWQAVAKPGIRCDAGVAIGTVCMC